MPWAGDLVWFVRGRFSSTRRGDFDETGFLTGSPSFVCAAWIRIVPIFVRYWRTSVRQDFDVKY